MIQKNPPIPQERMSGYKSSTLSISLHRSPFIQEVRGGEKGSALLCVQCYATESIHCKSLTCCLEVSFHIHLAITNKSLT